jgi:hypothetical protein
MYGNLKRLKGKFAQLRSENPIHIKGKSPVATQRKEKE